jgi:hypothetical protein
MKNTSFKKTLLKDQQFMIKQLSSLMADKQQQERKRTFSKQTLLMDLQCATEPLSSFNAEKQ